MEESYMEMKYMTDGWSVVGPGWVGYTEWSRGIVVRISD
jgi:hypothetical protein